MSNLDEKGNNGLNKVSNNKAISKSSNESDNKLDKSINNPSSKTNIKYGNKTNKFNSLNKSIDLGKIYENKFVKIIINILFSFSTACLTDILIVRKFSTPLLDILLPCLSFLIMLFVCFKFDFLKKIFGNAVNSNLSNYLDEQNQLRTKSQFKSQLKLCNNSRSIILIISAVLGLFLLYKIYTFTNEYVIVPPSVIATFLAFFAVITFLYWFYSKLWYYFKKFCKSLDKLEKNFLIIATCIFSVVIIVVYNVTSVFTAAHIAEEDKKYVITYSEETDEAKAIGNMMKNDVFGVICGNLLFTADTQFIIGTDAYNNINAKENDIRQPLFGLFALPFTIAPRLIADLTFDEIYPFLIAIVQGFMVFVTIILLEKLMKLKGITRLLFMLFLTFSYPTLLFLVNMEQYVIHVFYLIIFIYMSVNKIQDKDMSYIMATGTLVTTGILFPLLGETVCCDEKGTLKKKIDWKKSIKNIFLTFLKLAAILIISGKIILYTPNQLKGQLSNLTTYTSSTSDSMNLKEQLNMYTHFAFNTVAAPKVKDEEGLLASKVMLKDDLKVRIVAYNYNIQQTENAETNITGIFILLGVIAGFILNRKDFFSKICFAWVLFSVALLAIIGYGASENGFILYSYYFSWAFICLLFKLFEILLSKSSNIKNAIYVVAIVPLAIINLYGIYELVMFGLQYYI